MVFNDWLDLLLRGPVEDGSSGDGGGGVGAVSWWPTVPEAD